MIVFPFNISFHIDINNIFIFRIKYKLLSAIYHQPLPRYLNWHITRWNDICRNYCYNHFNLFSYFFVLHVNLTRLSTFNGQWRTLQVLTYLRCDHDLLLFEFSYKNKIYSVLKQYKFFFLVLSSNVCNVNGDGEKIM